MAIFNILQQISDFSNLTPAELKALEKLMTLVPLSKGDMLFNHGDSPAQIHILLEGQIKSVKYTEDGKEVVLHMVTKNDLFAMVPAYLNIPYTGTAIAVKKSKVGRINRQDFLNLLQQFPEVALKMMGSMALRTKELLVRIEEQTVYTPLERIVRFLIREMQKNSSTEFNLPLNKIELAKTLGTTPETLSRCFAELSRTKLVQIDKKKVQVFDLMGLFDLGKTHCEEKTCWLKECDE